MKLLRSFTYAFLGTREVLRERNMRVHLCCAVLAIVLGGLLEITREEWWVVILSIALVLVSETLNTAIEKAMDLHTSVHPETYPKAGLPKDIGAAAVCMSAVTALLLGGSVFLPYILSFFTGT